MPPATNNDFLKCLRKSRVIDDQRLEQWLAKNRLVPPDQIPVKMVSAGLLTRWQAELLLRGKSHLFLGSYQLLERTCRDEMGDRFIAVHQSLDRKVDIQLFPADLTKDPQRREAFIQKASRAAKVDHFHLAHVYDIDKQGGRYYVVTEHVEGTPLDQMPRDLIRESDVLQWVHDVVSGLEHAHKNGVKHGNLTQSDLLITDDGEVKVVNLVVSPLREMASPNGSSKTGEENDFRAIAKIAVSLLRSIPDAGEIDRARLKPILQAIATGDSGAVSDANAQLASWLNELRGDSFVDAGLGDDFADDEYGDEYDGEEEDESEADDKKKLTLKPPRWLVKFAKKNPVGFVATLIVLGLMVLVGTLLLAYGMIRPVQHVAKVRHEKVASAFPKAPGGDEEPEEEIDMEAIQQVINSLPEASVPEEPKPKPKPKPQPKPKPEPQPKPKPESQGAGATSPSAAGAKTTPTPPATSKTNPKPAEAAKPAEDANPFSQFASSVDLPPVETVSETRLDDLVISDRYLLGLELVTDEAVSRSKLIFEMERSPDDKQKWIVSVRRRVKERPTNIAQFRKSENAFLFQWLPAAEKNRYAQYLRNGFLKLKVPDKTHLLALRAPVKLPPIVLTKESLSDTIEAALPYPPRADAIAIEILPPKVSEVELSVSPSIIELQEGGAGRVFFNENGSKAFVWIQVGVELRSKLKIRTALVLLSQGRVQPIKSVESLNEMATALKQIEAVALNRFEVAKNTRAPYGQGDKYDEIRDDLEKKANLAKEAALKGAKYAQAVPKVMGQPIKVRVYARLGQYRLELVNMDDVPPSSPSKK